MADKLRVGVIFGGRSAEHELSLMSAKHIFALLTQGGYQIVPIGITREGQWLLLEDVARAIRKMEKDRRCSFHDCIPAENAPPSAKIAAYLQQNVDVVFPVLHGRYGEDGTVQAVLELADVPYIGCGVLASALAMDKAATKKMLAAHRIPVVDALVINRKQWENTPETICRYIDDELNYPCFVKPVTAGSIIGISKVSGQEQLQSALSAAATHDRRILVEDALEGRKIEVAVLGNDEPIASVAGEIIVSDELTDHARKDPASNSELCIPADLTPRMAEKIGRLAIDVFKALDCAGLARIGFLLTRSGKLYVNEINTLPGFAAGSSYLKLWAHSGIEENNLLERLIGLALERYKEICYVK